MITKREDKEIGVYKFAVEFAFPSSGNFRSRPAFLYDRRISNLCEISGAMLFQQFRGFPVLDFNGGAGVSVNFSISPLPFIASRLSFYGQNFALNFLHSFSVHDDTEGSGAFQYFRKHVTSARRIRRDSTIPIFLKKKHIFLFMMISKKLCNMKKKYYFTRVFLQHHHFKENEVYFNNPRFRRF